MTNDSALIEKREELKRRLAAGEYKTLVDVFLEWFERLIRKITRQSKPLPLWLIMVILILALSLISFTVVSVASDWNVFDQVLGLEYGLSILVTIWVMFLAIAFQVMLNRYIGRIFFFWRNDVLDMAESAASLEEFEYWLEKVCNRRLHLLVIILGSFFASLSIVIPVSTLIGKFIGYGFTFVYIIVNMLIWSFVYQLFVIGLLSARLHLYDLKLFAADPAGSKLIYRLSSELNFVVYFVAVLAAVMTLTMALPGLLPAYGIFLVLLYWLYLIAIFVLNQTNLSSIIRRAKWKTINEIQAKVEKLQMKENFEDKETMEAINRLMDYHDRVKATRDSALDFRTYLSFFNSLLLPLLAFILGNLDLVLKLLGRNP